MEPEINIEQEIKEDVVITNTLENEEPVKPIDEIEEQDSKLGKAYLLFAELQNFDSTQEPENKVKILKELKTELDTVVGYSEADELKEIHGIVELKTKELDELTAKYAEANQKLTAQTEELKALKRLAKEFKAAKTGPLVNENAAMIEKTPQEIYDELIAAGKQTEASMYINRIRFGR